MALYIGWVGFIITAYFLISGINGLRKRNPKAKRNFLWMVIGLIICLFALGSSFIMVLFVLGFFAFIFFLIAGILALFKRNGKAKKRFLLMLGAMVIWLGSAVALPNDKKETNLQASEGKVKSKEESKKKAAALDKAKKEAEEKAKQEAQAEQKAKAEAEAKAKAEAEARAKAEAEAKAKAEAEAKAQQQQQTNPSTPSEQVSFANCTELRKVYPKGVPSDHPAYTAKMDRDNDGYACERN